jgi:phage protein D
MLTPAYKLTIRPGADDSSGSLGTTSELTSALPGGSGKVIDTKDEPKASTVTDLTVSLDLDTPADSFTLVMGQVGSFRMERGSEVTIELGYADQEQLTQVIKGTVITAEPGLTMARIMGHAAGPLLHNFTNETYEGSNAGAIVSDLADQAGVEVQTVEDGINFPAYVIDGRRSFYHHMRELADLCGFDLYINPEGKLVFEKFTGGKTVHVFELAKHIVELDVQRSLRPGQVEAWGESPTGSQGEDAWPWLIKDFTDSRGIAGSGGPLILLERSALRTAEAARSAAEALLKSLQCRSLRGRLKTIGRPQVKLGDAIRLSEMPDESLNVNFQVRSITHRITKREGFTTTIGFRAIEN